MRILKDPSTFFGLFSFSMFVFGEEELGCLFRAWVASQACGSVLLYAHSRVYSTHTLETHEAVETIPRKRKSLPQ